MPNKWTQMTYNDTVHKDIRNEHRNGHDADEKLGQMHTTNEHSTKTIYAEVNDQKGEGINNDGAFQNSFAKKTSSNYQQSKNEQQNGSYGLRKQVGPAYYKRSGDLKKSTGFESRGEQQDSVQDEMQKRDLKATESERKNGGKTTINMTSEGILKNLASNKNARDDAYNRLYKPASHFVPPTVHGKEKPLLPHNHPYKYAGKGSEFIDAEARLRQTQRQFGTNQRSGYRSKTAFDPQNASLKQNDELDQWLHEMKQKRRQLGG